MGAALGIAMVLVGAACLGAGLWVAGRADAAPVGEGPWSRLAVRGYPAVLLVLVLGPLFFIVGQASRPVEIVGGVIVAGLLGLALFSTGLNLAGYDPDAGRIAQRLSADQASQMLVARWLQRARWRRWLGGMLGLVLGFCLIENGSGGGRTLVLGLAGVAVGSLSAEVHHLRPNRAEGPRAADLADRRLIRYTTRREQLVLVGTAAVAAAGLLATVVGGRPGWAWWGTALAVVAVVAVLQRRVAGRRRPALPVELRRADDLLRRLAISRGMGRPALALVLGLLAQGLAALGSSVGAALCWLLALVLWWTGRRLGLDHLLREPVPA